MPDEIPQRPGQKQFERHYALLWTNLSRLNGLAIVANLTLFFLTRLVVEKGYYYTFYSLFFLGLVALLLLLPLGLFRRLWFYLLCLVLEGIGILFLVSSGWYRVVTTRVIMH
jgi:hypothetical protein